MLDWFSFALGFAAFPLLAALGLALYRAARRYVGQDNFSALAVSQRTSTLSFSSRLIGEIGEEDDGSDASPAAKAS